LATLGAFQFACTSQRAYETVAQNEELPRVEINGTLLHVVEEGPEDGEVVIALHGGPGGDHRYLQVLQPLTEKYRVVWYDQRGSGLSARGQNWQELEPIETYLEDLDQLVDLYGKGSRVHLLGHSWGAMLASAYAGRHAEKVHGLILAEPGFLTYSESEALMNERPGFSAITKVAGAWLRKWHVSHTDPEARDDWFFTQAMAVAQPDAYFCDGGPAESVRSWRAGSSVYQATIGRAQSDEEYFRSLDFVEGVDEIETEVLFLAGACDSLIGEEHQRRLARHFQNSHVVVIPEAGHYMFNDRPERSLEVVGSYLQRL
jgi:proline iminopeptidase